MSADTPPPAILQLAAHPIRWRLLRELAESDRAVAELTSLVGEPQNLISYHLGKLRGGGLVSSRRSSADRRDTFYGLDLARVADLLSAACGALHPGLRLSSPARVDPSDGGPVRILFVCTGNSARSQMAEALMRHLSGGVIAAVSAGSQPKALHPNAVRVMRDMFGLDISGQSPRHFDAIADQAFDWVISLCDRVREACPFPTGAPGVVHWSLANPATGEQDEITYPVFQETAAALATRIAFLLARIAAGPKAGVQDA